jgi:hypothetical protein
MHREAANPLTPTCEIRPQNPPRNTVGTRFTARVFDGLVILGIGSVAGLVVHSITPRTEGTSLATITGMVASLLAVILNKSADRMTGAIGRALRIGERLAPYFGHRIENAHRILKG